MTPSNYSLLDQPQVLNRLFHPRTDPGYRPEQANRTDMMIPVGDGVAVGASLHLADPNAPTILYFHGNGEIVSDYDQLGGVFNGSGLNFFVADYRGYGSSTGRPTVTAMMRDCHIIADYLFAYKSRQGLSGPTRLMGRS